MEMWLLAQTMPKAMWTFAIRVDGTWSVFIEGVAFYFSSPDNAYDPDVNASEIWIDKREINEKTCITFVDNGNGMDPNKLQKILRYKLKGSSLTCLMVNFI